MMTRKLTVGEYYAVRRAILAGMRHAEIARELQLSLWTIARIADGLRFVTDLVTDEQLPVDDGPPDYLAQNLKRCGGCGAMVYVWPCIACKLATAVMRVPPAEEVKDELVDVVGWDEVEKRRNGKRIQPRKTRKLAGQRTERWGTEKC